MTKKCCRSHRPRRREAGPGTREILHAALKDPESRVRAAAAGALGEQRDVASLEALRAALCEKSQDVRLALRQQSLEQQYSAMETALSTLQSQSSYLSSVLGSLSTSSTSSSSKSS